MTKDCIDGLVREAADLHNSKSYNERVFLGIRSASTQITTLAIMKLRIMESAHEQCRSIDNWIENCGQDLKNNLEEYRLDKKERIE